MDALEREGIVDDQRLSFRESIGEDRTLQEVNLTGWVSVAGGAMLYVDKWLAVSQGSSGAAVATIEYNYHGRLTRPEPGQDLFRYDNAHGDTSTLHRHRYDVNGVEWGIETIPLERMPSLAEVIRECHFYAGYLGERRSS